jgi:hypothetical protein
MLDAIKGSCLNQSAGVTTEREKKPSIRDHHGENRVGLNKGLPSQCYQHKIRKSRFGMGQLMTEMLKIVC